MMTSLFLLALAIGSGVLLTYLYDDEVSLWARLAAGSCIGLALLGLIGFIYASWFGLTINVVFLTAATLLAPAFLLTKTAYRTHLARDMEAALHQVRHLKMRGVVLLILYLLAALALGRFCERAIFERNGTIYTGAITNHGDLPLHLSIISGFAYGKNYPPEHPQFAGFRLTYPFIADFLTALLMRAGMSESEAMFWQSYILLLGAIGVLHRWARALTGDSLAAAFALVMLLFGGGLGWWLFPDDLHHQGGNALAALLHLSHEFTTESYYGLRWGNLLQSMLLPQRSFQLGLPLAMISCTQWWLAMEEPNAKEIRASAMRRMMGAGAIVGLLSLTHTSSLIVLLAMAGCLAVLFHRQWPLWTAFFAMTALFCAPQIWWLGHGSGVQPRNMFGWNFGWDKGSENFAWFWFKNTGLFLPLQIAALIYGIRERIVSRRLVLFTLPFLLLFIIPNVVRLMPWIWDNIKIMIYWYIATVPVVALLLARLWRSRALVLQIASVVLLFSLTTAGTLDVWRVVASGSEWPIFDSDAVTCARMIREKTPPRALVLHAPTGNHAVFLTGRRSLMGNTFMAWVHGLDIGSRQDEVKHMFAGAPDAENLLHRYQVDYALIGPAEREHLKIDERFFARFQKIGETHNYTLYEIPRE